MKLLYVCAYLPAEGISGGAARMFRVIRGMAQRHEVHVLSFYERGCELQHVPALEQVCASVRVIRRGQSPGEWRRDWLHQVPRAIAHEFGNPEMREAVCQALNRSQYDLANVEFLQMTYAMPRTRTVPTVLTHHEVQHRVLAQQLRRSHSPYERLTLFSAWLRMLNYEVSACRKYDRVLTMSAEEAAALRRWAPHQSIGFNNTGVDCDYFHPMGADTDEGSVVFAGYFRHQPNVDGALYFCNKVLPGLREKVPSVRVVLAGGEPPAEVCDLATDPAITVTGWLEDLRPVIARAAVFAAPIVTGAGLRGKVLEAWAMGKAVVSTSLGVDGLRAENEGNALIADTPGEFGAAVARLLNDRDLRGRISAAAVRTAREHYQWSVTLRQLEQEYEATLATRAHHASVRTASLVEA